MVTAEEPRLVSALLHNCCCTLWLFDEEVVLFDEEVVLVSASSCRLSGSRHNNGCSYVLLWDGDDPRGLDRYSSASLWSAGGRPVGGGEQRGGTEGLMHAAEMLGAFYRGGGVLSRFVCSCFRSEDVSLFID